MGINKVIGLGNLGTDPELTYTPTSTAICKFTIAVNEVWYDKAGEKKTTTEWMKIVVWSKLAENCAKYLKKGSEVFIEGKMQTRSWEKDGVTRYTTEINASNVQFIGGRNDG